MFFRHRSSTLAGGVSIKELAEYLGHADPAFTLRVYAHLLPSSHDHARAVINDRFSYLMTATGPLVPKRPDGSEPGTRSRNRDGTGSSNKARGTANPGVIG